MQAIHQQSKVTWRLVSSRVWPKLKLKCRNTEGTKPVYLAQPLPSSCWSHIILITLKSIAWNNAYFTMYTWNACMIKPIHDIYRDREDFIPGHYNLGRVKRIWHLSPMRAAKVQASLRIRAVSPEPSLLAHTSCESRGTFRQKARSLAPLNGWACAIKICHDGMLEDTNSLDGAQLGNIPD